MGNAGVSLGVGATAFFFDPVQANVAFTGERLYDRAWIYAPDTQQTFRVGSFNAASGAWVTAQMTQTAVASGAQIEVHMRLSPQQLNQCIDRTVSRFRFKQEVPINAITGAMQYNIDQAVPGVAISKVMDVYYYSQPLATDNRGRQEFDWWGFDTTASGTAELRIDPSVASGNQIIMNAIVDMTLGSAEAATINIPHDEWVYAGAAMHALNLLIQQAPGQAAGELLQRRREYAAWWRAVNANYSPQNIRSMRGAFDENPKGRWKL